MERTCELCGKTFFRVMTSWMVRHGKGKFCSQRCAAIGRWVAHNRTKKIPRCADCGKILSMSRYERCNSCVQKKVYREGRSGLAAFTVRKGQDHPAYGTKRTAETRKVLQAQKIGKNNPMYGKSPSAETLRKMAEAKTGPKSHLWKGGKSFEPYSIAFTGALKEAVRKRDNYTCLGCGMTEEEQLIVLGRALSVHHIDYDKNSCLMENLASTCHWCNNRANFNRSYWQEFYSKKVLGESANKRKELITGDYDHEDKTQ